MLKNHKLYYYEHCPYCIRVLAYCGMSDIQIDKQILLNDDEETPIKLIGQKVLPIFQYSDGNEKNFVMGESLDIIKMLAQNDGTNLVHCEEYDKIVIDFWNDLRLPNYSLAMPRWVKLPFAEFATPSSIDYFVKKKTKSIGDFQIALEKTDYWKHEFSKALEKYEPLFKELKKQPNTYAALITFSYLVGVTCVKNLILPKDVTNFLQIMSKKTGISLLFDKAI